MSTSLPTYTAIQFLTNIFSKSLKWKANYLGLNQEFVKNWVVEESIAADFDGFFNTLGKYVFFKRRMLYYYFPFTYLFMISSNRKRSIGPSVNQIFQKNLENIMILIVSIMHRAILLSCYLLTNLDIFSFVGLLTQKPIQSCIYFISLLDQQFDYTSFK